MFYIQVTQVKPLKMISMYSTEQNVPRLHESRDKKKYKQADKNNSGFSELPICHKNPPISNFLKIPLFLKKKFPFQQNLKFIQVKNFDEEKKRFYSYFRDQTN